jgi:hypothetical protein
VPPIRPQRPPPREQVVDVARDTNRDAADATRQRALVRGLHDEVHMVVLYGELKEPKALWVAPLGATQSEPNRRENMLTPQRRKPLRVTSRARARTPDAPAAPDAAHSRAPPASYPPPAAPHLGARQNEAGVDQLERSRTKYSPFQTIGNAVREAEAVTICFGGRVTPKLAWVDGNKRSTGRQICA